MTLRLFRAAEVCEMTELQTYVLRSWEKEFPGIGVQRTPEGPRLYRQADVDQVLRIKQLVFGEGLTVGGARRRLEDAGPPKISEAEAAEVLSTLGSEARVKVASVRDGLKAIQAILALKPGEFVLEPPPVKAARVAKPGSTAKGNGASKERKLKESRIKANGSKANRATKPAKSAVASSKRAVSNSRASARKSPDAKRRRASA